MDNQYFLRWFPLAEHQEPWSDPWSCKKLYTHLYDAYSHDLYEAMDPNPKSADSNKMALAGFIWLLIRPMTRKVWNNSYPHELKRKCLRKPDKALVNDAVGFYW